MACDSSPRHEGDPPLRIGDPVVFDPLLEVDSVVSPKVAPRGVLPVGVVGILLDSAPLGVVRLGVHLH